MNDPESARAALREVQALRRRVRADRHPLSAPLLIMGAIATAGATLDLREELSTEQLPPGPALISSNLPFVYWLIAVPSAFGLLAVVEWWRWRRRGLDGGGRRIALVSVLVLAVAGLPFAWFLTNLLGPLAMIGAGLLLAGVWLREPPLAFAGTLFGILGALEGLFWISNRVPSSAWRPWTHNAIVLGLAGLMFIAGAVTWLRERRPGR